jgi:hypothetical protein
MMLNQPEVIGFSTRRPSDCVAGDHIEHLIGLGMRVTVSGSRTWTSRVSLDPE